VVEHRLREETRTAKNQFGFLQRKSTAEEGIYLLWGLIESYWSKTRDLHMVFIKLEKSLCSSAGKCYGRLWKTN